MKTVSQTLQRIQNCLDKSINMHLIIHTFYPVFRTASHNQKVERFDHSIKEMHQNFLLQTKSSWSQTERLVLVCNTDTSNHCMWLYQICTLWMTQLFFFYIWKINIYQIQHIFQESIQICCYLVDGNLIKCVLYVNLCVGRALYANLRVTLKSALVWVWLVIDRNSFTPSASSVGTS